MSTVRVPFGGAGVAVDCLGAFLHSFYTVWPTILWEIHHFLPLCEKRPFFFQRALPLWDP